MKYLTISNNNAHTIVNVNMYKKGKKKKKNQTHPYINRK